MADWQLVLLIFGGLALCIILPMIAAYKGGKIDKKNEEYFRYLSAQRQMRTKAQYQPSREYLQKWTLTNIRLCYHKKDSIMNNNEQRVFYFCNEILREKGMIDYYVFPQVNISSIIAMNNGERSTWQNKKLFDVALSEITSKSVDILICKKIKNDYNGKIKYEYRPAMVLEYDGKGHGISDRQKRNDYFKDTLFFVLQIQFYRIPYRSDLVKKEEVKCIIDQIQI